MASKKEQVLDVVVEDVELATAKSGNQDTEEQRILRLKLYRAALNGEWDVVKNISAKHPPVLFDPITKRGDTILHIAVQANKTEFVRRLYELWSQEASYIRNQAGNTALSLAAASGNLELVKVIVMNNLELAMTRGGGNILPIETAAILGHREIVQFLYELSGNQLEEYDRKSLFVTLVDADIYDVALEMLRNDPKLATARAEPTSVGDRHKGKVVGETALHAFARKLRMAPNYIHQTRSRYLVHSPLGFHIKKMKGDIVSNRIMKNEERRLNAQARELVEKIWEQVILMSDSKISSLIGAPSRLIFTAAKQGNHEFLKILIHSYPDLIFKVDESNNYSIFHYAILHRHEEIFKWLHEMGSIKNVITTYKDEEKNNMLHLVALFPSQSRLNVAPGPALQLQRELLWFEEVKKIVPQRQYEEENRKGKSPKSLFLETHETLRKTGEEWMIKTANSCMIVAIAVLIASVVFAAAFMIPGNSNAQDANIIRQDFEFKLFAVADAVSLLFSATSVLTFMSILTSRYAVDDFLWSLPHKLITGLITLFGSIVAVIVAFLSVLSYTFSYKLLQIVIPVVLVASLPVLLFVRQQSRLYIDVCRSTYMSTLHLKPDKEPLFSTASPKEKSWFSFLFRG